MGAVFNNVGVGVLSAAPDSENIATLKVGGKIRDFLMAGPVDSKQSDRIQIDASADGKLHVTSCKGSVGSCSITLLDAVAGSSCFSDSKGNVTVDASALKYYTKELNSFAKRKAELVLYAGNSKLAKFDGIIQGVSVRVQYSQQNVPMVVVTLDLIGAWTSA